MQWTADRHAGFSPPDTPTTWLPVHPDYPRRNVAVELEDPDSHLSLYRRLLSVRRERRVLALGDIELEGPTDNPLVFRRHLSGEEPLWIALNLSDAEVDLHLPVPGRVVVATDRRKEGERAPSALGAWEAVVVE